MTCNIDHEAENAIPMFLCVACNREINITEGSRQTLDVAGAICAAVDQVRTLQPAVHVGESPLSAVKQTWQLRREMSANPKADNAKAMAYG